MQVYLDNEVYHPPAQETDTVFDLVSHLKKHLAPQKKMIVSILCDQVCIAERDIEQVLKRSVGDFQRLDLITVSVPELAADVLAEAKRMLADSREEQAQLVELLSQGAADQAMELLAKCTTSWAQAHDAVLKTIRLLDLNIDNLTFDHDPVVDILNSIAQQLGQLKECISARDFVLLNDLMQYEIMPSFGRWEGMITAIQQAIQN